MYYIYPIKCEYETKININGYNCELKLKYCNFILARAFFNPHPMFTLYMVYYTFLFCFCLL